MNKNKLKNLFEKWNQRTSSGENPHVSKDSFGSAIRAGDREYDENMQKIRMNREKAVRDKITATARKKSYNAAQANKKKMFENLNNIFKC